MAEWKLALRLGGTPAKGSAKRHAHAHIRGKQREIKVRVDLPEDPDESPDERRLHIAALVRAALQSAIDEIPFHDADAIGKVELKEDAPKPS